MFTCYPADSEDSGFLWKWLVNWWNVNVWNLLHDLRLFDISYLRYINRSCYTCWAESSWTPWTSEVTGNTHYFAGPGSYGLSWLLCICLKMLKANWYKRHLAFFSHTIYVKADYVPYLFTDFDQCFQGLVLWKWNIFIESCFVFIIHEHCFAC